MKFKIGDKVQIISNISGSNNKIGDIGEIVKIDNYHSPEYKVLVVGNSEMCNWQAAYELELYEETKFVENIDNSICNCSDFYTEQCNCDEKVLEHSKENNKKEGLADFSVEDLKQEIEKRETNNIDKVDKIIDDIRHINTTLSNKPYKEFNQQEIENLEENTKKLMEILNLNLD